MAQPFGHDLPKLSWLGAKTFSQHGMSRKNHPGHSTEHAAANKTNLLMAAEALAHIEDAPAQLLLTEGTK